tara:strand:- start:1796 stop:2260 length:465 start_codon:yes stop_codon:yes gene_type:complete
MPYVGKQPTTGEFIKLDSITTSATATYALTRSSGAFFPGSANQLIVSLNGVTQAPIDAFTVSGSNIVFASALTSSDVIDYILVLGEVGNSVTPTDGSVTGSKLSSTIYREGILVNSSTLTTNTTIASGERGLVAGNYSVNSGVTLTINGELVIV